MKNKWLLDILAKYNKHLKVIQLTCLLVVAVDAFKEDVNFKGFQQVCAIIAALVSIAILYSDDKVDEIKEAEVQKRIKDVKDSVGIGNKLLAQNYFNISPCEVQVWIERTLADDAFDYFESKLKKVENTFFNYEALEAFKFNSLNSDSSKAIGFLFKLAFYIKGNNPALNKPNLLYSFKPNTEESHFNLRDGKLFHYYTLDGILARVPTEYLSGLDFREATIILIFTHVEETDNPFVDIPKVTHLNIALGNNPRRRFEWNGTNAYGISHQPIFDFTTLHQFRDDPPYWLHNDYSIEIKMDSSVFSRYVNQQLF